MNVEIFLYKSGFVSSFCDGGDYFKNSDVKKYWEAKEKHSKKSKMPKSTINTKALNKGIGTILIYDLADLIYFDNKKNKLYLGINKKDLFN